MQIISSVFAILLQTQTLFQILWFLDIPVHLAHAHCCFVRWACTTNHSSTFGWHCQVWSKVCSSIYHFKITWKQFNVFYFYFIKTFFPRVWQICSRRLTSICSRVRLDGDILSNRVKNIRKKTKKTFAVVSTRPQWAKAYFTHSAESQGEFFIHVILTPLSLTVWAKWAEIP